MGSWELATLTAANQVRGHSAPLVLLSHRSQVGWHGSLPPAASPHDSKGRPASSQVLRDVTSPVPRHQLHPRPTPVIPGRVEEHSLVQTTVTAACHCRELQRGRRPRMSLANETGTITGDVSVRTGSSWVLLSGPAGRSFLSLTK